VTFRPFCAVIPLCAHALDDPEDKLRIPSSNISHVRFFIPISPQRLGSFTALLPVKLVQAMIKPADTMWHESMEILANENIRGMNNGVTRESPPESLVWNNVRPVSGNRFKCRTHASFPSHGSDA
jgi:hypothetical protein